MLIFCPPSAVVDEHKDSTIRRFNASASSNTVEFEKKKEPEHVKKRGTFINLNTLSL